MTDYCKPTNLMKQCYSEVLVSILINLSKTNRSKKNNGNLITITLNTDEESARSRSYLRQPKLSNRVIKYDKKQLKFICLSVVRSSIHIYN